jgi:cytochrome b561
MIKPKINYLIEVVMIICFLFVAITSIFIGDEEGNFFNESIIEIHHAVGIALLALIVLHVLLHFKFISAMTKNLFKRKI